MKRLFVFLGTLLLLFSIIMSNGIISSASSKVDNVTLKNAEHFAMDYLITVSQNSFDGWKNASLEKGKKLYDFDGNLTSYLFQVKNQGKDQGYIIISAIPEIPGVLESTREGSNPYVDVKESDSIYVGPVLHFSKVDNEYAMSLSNKKVEKKSKLKSNAPLSYENIEKYADATSTVEPEQIGTQAVTNYKYKLISGVPDYTWDIGCAPTSGANIVKYWDSRGYPNLVGTSQTTHSLIDQLATSMNTNRSTGGTSVSNMRTGMINFWGARGYGVTVTTYSGSFSTHINEINAGRPDWVTTANHPVWGDHAMTGVGYEEYYNTSDFTWYRQVILHDTWSSTPVDYWIKWTSYFDYVIKVQPN
ncbi:C39 family peptidase [Ectobacillus antri]|uniref:C39 family peptidase n=1 Tax=Ectobacillus antri TaxID=2486280 RepID=UPI000F59B09B|nr:C39 family peptidase [Ectobacillus antri]